eukprot:m51a1_g839 putative N-alpha-acetyltransferase (195) ;mRNA; r:760747-761495
MVTIRKATVDDLPQMQHANLCCLPENYQMKYYLYHALSWPNVSHVAVNARGQIVGYVLAKIEEEEGPIHGHITSISVLRTYRKLGIANMLLTQAHRAMKECYNAEFCSLHVRRSNRGAFSLYHDSLGYNIHDVDEKYYGDGEDALAMRCPLLTKEEQKQREEEKKEKERKAREDRERQEREQHHQQQSHGRRKK